MNHRHLTSVPSTNSYLKEWLKKEPNLEAFTVVTAHEQTAGRGQKGNHWEAEPGKNLTLSLLLRPQGWQFTTPFALNMVTSLALTDLLSPHLSVQIKWPNDILVERERKIAGILTENTWIGNDWSYAIVGVGLNMLQTSFQPYTPPATSLLREGVEVPPNWHDALLQQLIDNIQRLLSENPEALKRDYLKNLFRYQEERALYALLDGTTFHGTLIGVAPSGHLILYNEEKGVEERFAFKEVQFR